VEKVRSCTKKKPTMKCKCFMAFSLKARESTVKYVFYCSNQSSKITNSELVDRIDIISKEDTSLETAVLCPAPPVLLLMPCRC